MTLLEDLRAALGDVRTTAEHRILHWKSLREINRLEGELRICLADETIRKRWEARLQEAINRTPARQGRVQ